MSDGAALHAAVCENPREDTPRLVYADWLEENGQAGLAAFIRTDIAMSLRDEWDTDRIRWEQSLDATLNALPSAASLFPSLPNGCNWSGPPLTRRGFAWSIELRQPDVVCSSHPDLLIRHPILRMCFSERPPSLRRLCAVRHAHRLTGFVFRTPGFSRLLTPIYDGVFSDVEELAIHSGGLKPEEAAALFASPIIGQLTALSLAGLPTPVGEVVAEGLAGPGPVRLRSLALRAALPGADDLARLAGLRLPESVRCLDLSHNHLNTERVSRMVASSAFAGVRVLTLRSNLLGNAGTTAVLTAPHFAGLKVLDLSFCFVGDYALRVLLENSPLADSLNFLDLTGSPATAEIKFAVKERMGDRVRI